MKRCVKCNLPETHETITFDSDGVCNICNQNLFKKEEADEMDTYVQCLNP